MDDVTPERWLPIAGYEGLYEVSDLGRVRVLVLRNGRGTIPRITVMKPNTGKQGYRMLRLVRDGKPKGFMVHRLVAWTFLGPRPEGLEIRHLNDNKLDNRLVNLAYGTRSENKRDSVRNGIHPCSSKTHCKRGHEFTPENTYSPPGHPEHRTCRACNQNGIKPGAFNRNKTHCKRGHEFTEENTYITGGGSRDCRACRRERNAKR